MNIKAEPGWAFTFLQLMNIDWDFAHISANFANIITLLALIYGKSNSKTISSLEEPTI